MKKYIKTRIKILYYILDSIIVLQIERIDYGLQK
jgi:hypothetical protein